MNESKLPVGRPLKEVLEYNLTEILINTPATKQTLEEEALLTLRRLSNLPATESNLKIILESCKEVLKHSRLMELPVIESVPEVVEEVVEEPKQAPDLSSW